MKHLFIFKDNREHHQLASKISTITKELQAIIYFSSSLEESRRIIFSLDQNYRIYIVGGDGTINQLLDLFVNSKHEIVILPLGTGNDLNRTIGISKDPSEVLKASLQKEATAIDLIRINDTYSINVACFGLDSTIANHLHDETSLPIPKKFGYIIGIFKHIFKYHGYNIELINHDQLLYKGKITLFALANAPYYGGGFCIVPHANYKDGIIDVRVVDYIPLYRVPYLFLLLLIKKLEGRKEIHDYQLTKCLVYSDNPCNKDGEEYIADFYEFEIIKNAINIVITK